MGCILCCYRDAMRLYYSAQPRPGLVFLDFILCVIYTIQVYLLVSTAMALLDIIQHPDPRLSLRGQTVAAVDDTVKRLVTDMFETHYAQENCAALAATQLDTSRFSTLPPLRITVIDFSETKDQPLCLINPEIISKEGETNTPEGCMSIAGVLAPVRRAARIEVTALDESGRPLRFHADGFLAKCIQHELDHLDGVLFLQRLSKVKQKLLRQKLIRQSKWLPPVRD